MKTVIAKGKELSNYVKHSGPQRQALKKACKDVGCRYTSLKNPNDTRWNSKESNLSSIIKLKAPLQHLANGDETGNWSTKIFSPAEWKMAEAAVEVLKIPLYTTKMWEAEKTPTMNLVVSELYSMKERLRTLGKSSCRFKAEFARSLEESIEKRFPECGTNNKLRYGMEVLSEILNNLFFYSAICNYLDPSVKGIHLEELGKFDETKSLIVEEIKEEAGGALEAAGREPRDEEAEEEDDAEDPTARLLRARRLSGEARAIGKLEQIKKEMELYEKGDGVVKLENLKTNGDRLMWWKEYEKLFPHLAKLAKHFLGIPCSSSKSERVFSVGAQMVTKKRTRLSCRRSESLMILHENRKLVEDFYQDSSYKKEEIKTVNKFSEIHEERDNQASDIFDEGEDSDVEMTDESDEDE
jgi:hypothetical protein